MKIKERKVWDESLKFLRTMAEEDEELTQEYVQEMEGPIHPTFVIE
jgi:hypothetical protein